MTVQVSINFTLFIRWSGNRTIFVFGIRPYKTVFSLVSVGLLLMQGRSIDLIAISFAELGSFRCQYGFMNNQRLSPVFLLTPFLKTAFYPLLVVFSYSVQFYLPCNQAPSSVMAVVGIFLPRKHFLSGLVVSNDGSSSVYCYGSRSFG